MRLELNAASRFSASPQSAATSFFPAALPELAIYRMAGQKGMARYQLEIADSKTGGLIHRSPLVAGTVFLNQYTVYSGLPSSGTIS